MNGLPPVPPEVIANVQRRWPSIATTWAANLDRELKSLCEQHQATVRAVLPARYGYVVATDSPFGPLVMRSSPDPLSPDQAAVATALADLGISPVVHQTRVSAHGTWTVSNRVLPGTSLNRTDLSSISPAALFEPLTAMRDQPPPRAEMPSIVDWLRLRLEDEHLDDLRPGTTIATDRERATALLLLADLSQDHKPALCHGDASSGNIIRSGSIGWMYIDPRGMSGDYTYDVAVVATRLTGSHPIAKIIRDASSVTGIASGRLRAWAEIAQAARV